ncbi:hypothetical protein [Nodosilinea nodulosa]|uniref:hypothetical protein n=1 Tax=Nodosilinea nodulosa TaxID=416001 RepID=UPI0012D7D39E|nr:hypothetical protein [Nodosilinea nodulosa]
MTQPSHHPNSASEPAMATEHDLLAAILNPEPAYPWQPMAPEVEVYLSHLEAEFDALADGDLNTAIAAGWQILAAQMTDQMGAAQTATQSTPAVDPAAVTSVLDQLRQFQGRMPGGLLQGLATTATGLVRSGQPLIDQLVQCVGDTLPGWNLDDLAVLARPLAYSLRDGRGEILELNLRAIPAADWESLSSLEQARLALTIASVALKAAQEERGAS